MSAVLQLSFFFSATTAFFLISINKCRVFPNDTTRTKSARFLSIIDLLLDCAQISYRLFTKIELVWLYRRNKRHHVEKLYNLQKLTELRNVDKSSRTITIIVAKSCELYHIYLRATRHFVYFLLQDERHADSLVLVDTLQINLKLILHEVNEAT